MQEFSLHPLLLSLVLSFSIAFFIGKNRRMGFVYSLIFCITLTPLVGFIMTIMSPSLKMREAYTEMKGKYDGWAIACFVIAGCLAVTFISGLILYIEKPYDYYLKGILYLLLISVGLFTLGAYLKNPPEYLMPTDVELKPQYQSVAIPIIPKEKKVIVRKKIKLNFEIPYKLIVILLISLLFVGFILKPSYSRFKEFASDLDEKPYKTVVKKTEDYLICAFFEKTLYKWNRYNQQYIIESNEKYVGYLLNFYKLK